MRTNLDTNLIVYLTGKQYKQLERISEKVQPYLPFTEVVFIELINISRRFVLGKGHNDHILKNDLERFKSKYYARGFKINTHKLTPDQYDKVYKCNYIRMKEFARPYEPIERDIIVMLFRTCKRYVLTGMTKESEEELIVKLQVIANILN